MEVFLVFLQFFGNFNMLSLGFGFLELFKFLLNGSNTGFMKSFIGKTWLKISFKTDVSEAIYKYQK